VTPAKDEYSIILNKSSIYTPATLFNNLVTQFISIKPLFLAMNSPLSTANPTPAILISNFLASAVRDMPNSLAAQKQRRLLAFTFLLCPSENYDRNSHSFLIHQGYLLFLHE